jgi:hypothetical protein
MNLKTRFLGEKIPVYDKKSNVHPLLGEIIFSIVHHFFAGTKTD